jgi:enoyl-CoA hydratase
VAHENILVERRERVGLIRLNRPEALNALNQALLAEVMEALEAFDRDDQIHVMVLAGSDKAFAAGADIKEMSGKTASQMRAQDLLAVFGRIRALRKPVIAAVSGWALGGGCELAMSCDLIVASESARFGQPEITIGVIPGAGGTQRLTHAVGKALAMEMVLNNRTLTAQEALQFGLVNRVAPRERYLDEALALAAEIAGRAPLAVRAAKKMVNQSFERPLTDALDEERQEFYNLFGTADRAEGMQAFIEKRKPEWRGK